MNEDTQIASYKKQWEQVTLSDSSRLRIKAALEKEIQSPVVQPTVLPSPYLRFLKLTTVPVTALVIMILVGVSVFDPTSGRIFRTEQSSDVGLVDTSPTQQESTPSITSEVPDQTRVALLPPATSGQTPQDRTTPKTSPSNMRAVSLEEAVVEEVATTMMMADGLRDIGEYRVDITTREATYRTLIKKNRTKLANDTYGVFLEKLDSVNKLLTESTALEEPLVREHLDKASVLLGEIESELSLLGTVTVENGVIVDITIP